MKCYSVGGAVRDELLGLPVRDHDYVIVGATPDIMQEKGYFRINKKFPVFLHPNTQEEYALARTERKIAPGYTGFIFHIDPLITIEQDLARRDLTINAIAKDENNKLIDPFHGQHDLLHLRVFRHISNAFIEDPVRILRIARFSARFPEFSIIPETNYLMLKMVTSGEVQTLSGERIWKELTRGLMECKPSRMFEVLYKCGALAYVFPKLHIIWNISYIDEHYKKISNGIHIMQILDYAASQSYSLEVRFTVLLQNIIMKILPSVMDYKINLSHNMRCALKLIIAICNRLKVPIYYRDLAIMTIQEYNNIVYVFNLDPVMILNLFTRCNAFKKIQRFYKLLQAVECNLLYSDHSKKILFSQKKYLIYILQAILAIDTKTIALKCKKYSQNISKTIFIERIKIIKRCIMIIR